jgi:hypothetical protein
MLLESLRQWISRKAVLWGTTRQDVRGLAVKVVNTRPDVRTGDVLARLDEALGLIEEYVAALSPSARA